MSVIPRSLRPWCRQRALKTVVISVGFMGAIFILLEILSLRGRDEGLWKWSAGSVTISSRVLELSRNLTKEGRTINFTSLDVTCRLPDLDPFNPEVMREYAKEKPIDCSGAMDDWIYVKDGQFHISTKAQAQYGNISCKYTPMLRANDYETKMGSPIDPIADGSNIPSDFFKVECSSKSSGKQYTNIHLAVARNEDIFKRLDSYKQERQLSEKVNGAKHKAGPDGLPYSGQNLNLSVFIYGYDSMSRMSYLRNLPKTRDYFVNAMGAVELEGYNIVGDGTPAALLPILTGHKETELPEARRGKKGAQQVDGHPWVYKDYRRQGYVTCHGEDVPASGTFQYRMLGFKEQPTDHYMRTFYLAAPPFFKNNKQFCLGSLPRHVRHMNWYQDLFSMYRDYPKIFFGWHAELSHGYFNKPQVMDDDLLTFLKDLEKDGHLNNTLVILMADHGARFNHIRAIPQGKLEERNPYMALRFPPWFLKRYPAIAANLKANSKRLTTPYDIHETLSDLINFQSDDGTPRRGLSLLKKVPEDRTCSQAGVTPHWCACLAWQPASDSHAVASAVDASLEKINSVTSKQRSLCAELKVREITRALRYVPTPSEIAAEQKYEDFKASDPMKPHLLVDKYLPPLLGSERELYQVSFITEPGHGHFEVTCTLNTKSKKISLNVNDISRMNKYGDAPKCLQDKHPEMNPFCYCH